MSEYEYPPGSEEAIDMGGTCPVIDNCHGEGSYKGDGYIINPECPLHGVETANE